MWITITALSGLVTFYCVYLGKMLVQRRKGIQTNQLGKGDKPILEIHMLQSDKN